MARARLRLVAYATVATLGVLVSGGAFAQPVNFPLGEVPASSDDGGFRYLQVATSSDPLNLHQAPAEDARVSVRINRGTVLTNLGCTAGAARAWCYVQPLQGGPVGYAAAEFLRPAVSPNGAPVSGPNDSPMRAGQGDFDATGQVPCAQSSGGQMAICDFGVARAGGGDATVVLTRPDGRPRAVFFSMGQAMGADTSEADPGVFSASRDGDTTIVTVGSETYEIPDAIPFGG